LRSDGRITLAPRFQELYDSPSAYLWALARDSKEICTRAEGRAPSCSAFPPNGEKKTFAEFQALENSRHCDCGKDRVYAAALHPNSEDLPGRARTAKVKFSMNPKTKYIWALGVRL